MILRSLQTLNYRHLEPGKLEFPLGLIAVVGGNAQGKTNLLEAAFVCLTGVLEVSKVETVIRLGEHEAFVGLELEREDGITKLEVGLGKGKKLAKVDGVRVRTVDLARHASAVLIRPEDADLVHGSPSQRRAFLDALVSKMSPRYAQALVLYERTLAQRNAALKVGGVGLEVWDARFAELGAEIMRLRRRAVTKLKTLTESAHQNLADNNKKLEFNLVETARLEDFQAH
jgi:DNA replication and repair protein RecF